MDLAAIEKLAYKKMGRRQTHPYREPGYIFYHGQRVAGLALQLRELIFPAETGDDEVIVIGSWFHDVAKGIEPHWEYGAHLAGKILKKYCPPQKLAQIQEIIRGHTLRKEKDYPNYVKLVQDADILDHYGTMEIWLNFSYAAGQKGTVSDVWEFYDEEYKKRLKRVKALLNYALSVEIFEEKDQFVQDFMARLRSEGEGNLFLNGEKAES